MSKALGDYEHWPMRGGQRELYNSLTVVDVGATGAPTKRTGSPPGTTVTRTGVGAYTFRVPLAPTGALSAIKVWVVKSAVVFHVVQLTEPDSNGDATFAFFNNAATPVAQEAASGDVFCVEHIAMLEKA